MSVPYLFLPGPMEGVMSPEFIRGARELDLADMWVTPFFRLSSALPREKYFRAFLAPYLPGKVILQLMGRDPELLAEAAAIAESLGAAGVDLNLGCPSAQVLRHGAGAGLLKTPSLACKILRRIRGSVRRIPVSAKLRCGWESQEELPGLLNMLLEAEVSGLTLHFRTAQELYRELPGERERRFAVASECLRGRCPFLLNGDFLDHGEMISSAEKFGAAGVMAARGFLRDPGLLRRAEGKSMEPPEILRRKLFCSVAGQYPDGMPAGRAVELSIFLWGKDNPVFRRLAGRREYVFRGELDRVLFP